MIVCTFGVRITPMFSRKGPQIQNPDELIKATF